MGEYVYINILVLWLVIAIPWKKYYYHDNGGRFTPGLANVGRKNSSTKFSNGDVSG